MNIFFAHVKNTNNMGDKRCCPYYYYQQQYFKNFNCQIIDINQIPSSNINSNDFIIIGGGGILDHSENWNNYINSAFNKTKNVIFWGCGYNIYDKNFKFKPLDLTNSMLLGIRDYYHPYFKFLPCVSCKSIFFNRAYEIKRKIGIIKHHCYKINVDNSLNKYDVIYNDQWIEKIIKFIGESEYILSDSYHALYWSTLLNKKVGRLNNYYNSRFQYCMYQYPHVDTYDKLINCKSFSITNNDLQYFRLLNDNFFNKVKNLIQN